MFNVLLIAYSSKDRYLTAWRIFVGLSFLRDANSVQKIVGDYVLQHMLYTWSDVAAASELSPKSVVRAQLNTNIIYEQLSNTCRRKPAHSLVLQSGIRRFSSESARCLFFSQLLCRLLVILLGFFSHWLIFSCQTWMTSEQKNRRALSVSVVSVEVPKWLIPF